MSVSPIRCVPIARWLKVGSRSSIACPPFLNCARASPAKPPSASASPAHEINRLLIHTLLFDRESLLGAIPHCCRHRRPAAATRKQHFLPAPAALTSRRNKNFSLHPPQPFDNQGLGFLT